MHQTGVPGLEVPEVVAENNAEDLATCIVLNRVAVGQTAPQAAEVGRRAVLEAA
jgi:hypothetical protein